MTKTIERVSTGAIWEDIVGYSRAVRIGDRIEIAGTTAVDENDQVVGVEFLNISSRASKEQLSSIQFQTA